MSSPSPGVLFQPSPMAASKSPGHAGCSLGNVRLTRDKRLPAECCDPSDVRQTVLGPVNKNIFCNVWSMGKHLNSQNSFGQPWVSLKDKVAFSVFRNILPSNSG